MRALAATAVESRLAARGFPEGFIALDYFGDADLLALAASRPIRILSLPRDLGRPRRVPALARAALGLDWSALVYAGGLENRPGLLRRLERHGAVLGNGSDVVRRVRDPLQFFTCLRRLGVAHPAIVVGGHHRVPARGGPWLWKPIRSGGGVRIRRAVAGEPRPRGFYRQAHVEGAPGSISFVADGERAAVLGAAEQLDDVRRVLGGRNFRYRGSICGPLPELLSRSAYERLARAADGLTRRFGLRGLNGLDFILARGEPHVLELNPRYTASMELLGELAQRNLLDTHLEALENGRLPDGPFPAPGFLAKGILYATRRTVWPGPAAARGLDVRDRPMPDETIEAGQPICTLVESGASADACRRRLAESARCVRGRLCYDTRKRASFVSQAPSFTGRPGGRCSP